MEFLQHAPRRRPVGDDSLSTIECVEQLTFLLFLKLAAEREVRPDEKVRVGDRPADAAEAVDRTRRLVEQRDHLVGQSRVGVSGVCSAVPELSGRHRGVKQDCARSHRLSLRARRNPGSVTDRATVMVMQAPRSLLVGASCAAEELVVVEITGEPSIGILAEVLDGAGVADGVKHVLVADAVPSCLPFGSPRSVVVGRDSSIRKGPPLGQT